MSSLTPVVRQWLMSLVCPSSVALLAWIPFLFHPRYTPGPRPNEPRADNYFWRAICDSQLSPYPRRVGGNLRESGGRMVAQ